MNSPLDHARAAFERCDWAAAFDGFATAQASELTADDVFHQADAAWWLGRIEHSLSLYEAAVSGYLDEGRPNSAALAALLLSAHAKERGDEAIALFRDCTLLSKPLPSVAS